MKYCENCGNPLDDNAMICPHCGQAVETVYAPPVSPAQPVENTAYMPAENQVAVQAVDDEKKQKKLKILTIALIALPILIVLLDIIAFTTAKPVEATPYYASAATKGDYVSTDIAYIEPLAKMNSVDSETQEVKSTKSYYCLAVTTGYDVLVANVPTEYYEQTLSIYSDNYDSESNTIIDSSKYITIYADVADLKQDLIDLYPEALNSDNLVRLNNQQLDVHASPKTQMNGALLIISFLLFVGLIVVIILRKKAKAS